MSFNLQSDPEESGIMADHYPTSHSAGRKG
jgi:hypothetical protein